MMRNPDNSISKRVEIVRDPKRIDELLKRRDARLKAALKVSHLVSSLCIFLEKKNLKITMIKGWRW